jgi:hypothetical protein
MKIRAQESIDLLALQPLEVAAWLRAHGWSKHQDLPGNCGSVWRRTVAGVTYEVMLPLDRRLSDFRLRLGELLETLVEVDGRATSELFNELLVSTHDILRIRLMAPDLSDGSLAVDDFAQLASQTRELLLAAACSAIEPRPFWHSRKPDRAVDQVRKLRVGQSERGSYILTVHSQVSPDLDGKGRLFEVIEPPFERQIMETLAVSLERLAQAATDAAQVSSVSSFESEVRHGVSANLCAAVAGLWDDWGRDRQVEFGFRWSALRKVSPQIPERVLIGADRIPFVREAGRILRERAPIPEFFLAGSVLKLERQNTDRSGQVTLYGFVEGGSGRVRVELSNADYELAIEAHKTGMVLCATGTLIKEGRCWVLQDPRDVYISPF